MSMDRYQHVGEKAGNRSSGDHVHHKSFGDMYASFFGSSGRGEFPQGSERSMSADECLYPSSPYQGRPVTSDQAQHQGRPNQVLNTPPFPPSSQHSWQSSRNGSTLSAQQEESFSLGPFHSIWSARSAGLAGDANQNHQQDSQQWAHSTTPTFGSLPHQAPQCGTKGTMGATTGVFNGEAHVPSSMTYPWSPYDSLNNSFQNSQPSHAGWNWANQDYSLPQYSASLAADHQQANHHPINEWELSEDEFAKKMQDADMRGIQERHEWKKQGIAFSPVPGVHVKSKATGHHGHPPDNASSIVASFLERYRNKELPQFSRESSTESVDSTVKGINAVPERTSTADENTTPVAAKCREIGADTETYWVPSACEGVKRNGALAAAKSSDDGVSSNKSTNSASTPDEVNDLQYPDTASDMGEYSNQNDSGRTLGSAIREIRSFSDPVTAPETLKDKTTRGVASKNGKLRPAKRKPKGPKDKRKQNSEGTNSRMQNGAAEVISVHNGGGVAESTAEVVTCGQVSPSVREETPVAKVNSSQPILPKRSAEESASPILSQPLVDESCPREKSEVAFEETPHLPGKRSSISTPTSQRDECLASESLSSTVQSGHTDSAVDTQRGSGSEAEKTERSANSEVAYCSKAEETMKSCNAESGLGARSEEQNKLTDSCLQRVSEGNALEEGSLKESHDQCQQFVQQGSGSVGGAGIAEPVQESVASSNVQDSGSSKTNTGHDKQQVLESTKSEEAQDAKVSSPFFDPKRIFGGPSVKMDKKVQRQGLTEKRQHEKNTAKRQAVDLESKMGQRSGDTNDSQTRSLGSSITAMLAEVGNGSICSKDLPPHQSQHVPSTRVPDFTSSSPDTGTASKCSTIIQGSECGQTSSIMLDESRVSDLKHEKTTISGKSSDQGPRKSMESKGAVNGSDTSRGKSPDVKGERRCSGESHMDGFHHPFGCSADCYRRDSATGSTSALGFTPAQSSSIPHAEGALHHTTKGAKPLGLHATCAEHSQESEKVRDEVPTGSCDQTRTGAMSHGFKSVSSKGSSNEHDVFLKTTQEDEKSSLGSAYHKTFDDSSTDYSSSEEDTQGSSQSPGKSSEKSDNIPFTAGPFRQARKEKCHEFDPSTAKELREGLKTSWMSQQKEKERKKQREKEQQEAHSRKKPTRATYGQPNGQHSRTPEHNPRQKEKTQKSSHWRSEGPKSSTQERERHQPAQENGHREDAEEDLARPISDEWWFQLGVKLVKGLCWMVLFAALLCLVLLSFSLSVLKSLCVFLYQQGKVLWAKYRSQQSGEEHRGYSGWSGGGWGGGWGGSGTSRGTGRGKTQSNSSGQNIELPTTEESAIRRLLAVDPDKYYEVLGVAEDASDDEIKKFYRKQCMLVHPDKTSLPRANEAFQILQKAYATLSDPDKRNTYDFDLNYKDQLEEQMDEFYRKCEEMMNTIPCSFCRGTHKRLPTELPIHAARYCSYHNTRHPAKDGDIWKETAFFKVYAYIREDDMVYDVTEWAACQCILNPMTANTCKVQYRVQRYQHAPRRPPPQYEEMFDNMFGQGTFQHSWNAPGQPGHPGQQGQRSSGGNQSNGKHNMGRNPYNRTRRSRKKKK
ncbi:uncharacterized protein [Diadema antillarum]|uniref:uncharacterized protein n=1 Tax=Diadema antillarum TaxID=105358 RepID=UPI003A8ACCA3